MPETKTEIRPNSDEEQQKRRPYRFFFSYASKSAHDGKVKRFYTLLTTRVWELAGGSKDDISFFDDESMQIGAHWRERLLEALETSQVLVYLVSPFYIESAYCGRELQIFLEREEKFKAANREAEPRLFLQPIIWTPIIGRNLPAALGSIQFRDNSVPADFVKQGLQTYMGRANEDAYEDFVRSLAVRIFKAGDGDRLPSCGRYQDVDAIPNAFDERPKLLPVLSADAPAPRMKCVYVAPNESEIQNLRSPNDELVPIRRNTNCYNGGGGWLWRPYDPDDPTMIGPLLQRFITEFQHDRVELILETNDLEANIREIVRDLKEAALRGEIVLMVVDAWATYLQPYKAFLKAFDTEVPCNHLILVPWNDRDPETTARHDDLQKRLNHFFYSKSLIPEYYKSKIKSVQEFEETLPNLLKTIRRLIDTHRADRKIIEPTRPAPVVRNSANPNHA